VKLNLDVADFREVQPPIIGDAKARLRIRDATVASLVLKAWVTNLAITVFDTAEETLESLIYTVLNILQYLRIRDVQGGPVLFPLREEFGGAVVIYCFLSLLPSITTIGKRLIVDPAALFERLLKDCLLRLGRVDPIAESLYHSAYIISQMLNLVK